VLHLNSIFLLISSLVTGNFSHPNFCSKSQEEKRFSHESFFAKEKLFWSFFSRSFFSLQPSLVHCLARSVVCNTFDHCQNCLRIFSERRALEAEEKGYTIDNRHTATANTKAKNMVLIFQQEQNGFAHTQTQRGHVVM
jgi:hypothetical protein